MFVLTLLLLLQTLGSRLGVDSIFVFVTLIYSFICVDSNQEFCGGLDEGDQCVIPGITVIPPSSWYVDSRQCWSWILLSLDSMDYDGYVSIVKRIDEYILRHLAEQNLVWEGSHKQET